MAYEPCDYPIGVSEIATVLSVKPSTVSQWGVRKNLPDCDAIVNGGNTKLWTLETILNWASSTGRNNRNLNNCNDALRLVVSDMMSEKENQMGSASSRWDKLSDEWNTYRESVGLDTYQKDKFRDLGSYESEEE